MILQKQDRSRICVSKGLWFLGDDDQYYRALVTLSGGIYVWTTQGPEACPNDSFDISDRKSGATFWLFADTADGGDGLYHAFRLTPMDAPFSDVHTWTDFTQQSADPRPHRTVRHGRVDGDLYLVDSSGYQHHAMTMLSGIFSERTQGFTVPV